MARDGKAVTPGVALATPTCSSVHLLVVYLVRGRSRTELRHLVILSRVQAVESGLICLCSAITAPAAPYAWFLVAFFFLLALVWMDISRSARNRDLVQSVPASETRRRRNLRIAAIVLSYGACLLYVPLLLLVFSYSLEAPRVYGLFTGN